MEYIYDQKLPDLIKMIQYVRALGYKDFGEFLEHREAPKEYNARVSLLQARIARIHELTKEPI